MTFPFLLKPKAFGLLIVFLFLNFSMVLSQDSTDEIGTTWEETIDWINSKMVDSELNIKKTPTAKIENGVINVKWYNGVVSRKNEEGKIVVYDVFYDAKIDIVELENVHVISETISVEFPRKVKQEKLLKSLAGEEVKDGYRDDARRMLIVFRSKEMASRVFDAFLHLRQLARQKRKKKASLEKF